METKSNPVDKRIAEMEKYIVRHRTIPLAAEALLKDQGIVCEDLEWYSVLNNMLVGVTGKEKPVYPGFGAKNKRR